MSLLSLSRRLLSPVSADRALAPMVSLALIGSVSLVLWTTIAIIVLNL